MKLIIKSVMTSNSAACLYDCQLHDEAMEAAQNHDKVVEVVVGDVSGQRVEFYLVLRDSSVPQRLRYLLQ